MVEMRPPTFSLLLKLSCHGGTVGGAAANTVSSIRHGIHDSGPHPGPKDTLLARALAAKRYR